jgi:hypothetical protein
MSSWQTIAHTISLDSPLTRQIWTTLLCWILEHEVPLSGCRGKAAGTHWQAICLRCGRSVRI